MIRHSLIAGVAFCSAMAMPVLAAAQEIAYAVYGGYTNVREGPSTRYQIIAQLAPGTEVEVLGCLETRAWCEIVVEDLQGWVYSRRLEFDYSGNRYLVPDYYAYFGAPFVYFNFGNYDDNYRHRRHRYRNWDDPGRPTGVVRPDRSFTYPDNQFALPSDGPPEPVIGGGGGATMPEQVFPEDGGGSSGICPPGDPNCAIAE